MEPAARRKLMYVASFVVLANTLDLLSTYAVSPNLAEEWNVLQRVYGLGWPGLVAAKLLGGGLAILGYFYYLRHRRECYPEPGASFRTFCRAFAYGTAHHPAPQSHPMAGPCGAPDESRRTPGELSGALGPVPALMHLGVNLGYFWAGMQALVVWVAVENILLGMGIAMPVRFWSELGYHMLQSAVVGGLVLARFFTGNYRRYQTLAQRSTPPCPLTAERHADMNPEPSSELVSASAFDKPARLC